MARIVQRPVQPTGTSAVNDRVLVQTRVQGWCCRNVWRCGRCWSQGSLVASCFGPDSGRPMGTAESIEPVLTDRPRSAP